MAAIGARALRGIDEKRPVGFLFFHNVFDRPTHVQSAGIQPTVAGWRVDSDCSQGMTGRCVRSVSLNAND